MSLRLKRSVGALVGATFAVVLAALVLALFPAVAGAQTKDKSTPSIVVRPGDSLWSISQERLAPNASPQRILKGTEQMYALNRELIGADPDLIFVGQELLLPPAMSSGRPTGATPAHGTAGKTTGAAEAGPRDRTAKGRTGSKATGKAPRTAAGGADAKVGNVPAPVADREAVRETEPVSLPDEAMAAPVPDVRTVASNETRVEGRSVQALGVLLLTLVVVALMAWKLPMRRTIRADAERHLYRRGSTTGRRRLTATTPPSRPARALPEARDREVARGERNERS